MDFLEPWIPHLAALGGVIVGAIVTWFVCRSNTQALRARFDERSRTAEKSIADLEAGCANLEAETCQLRHSEAVSLKRQSNLEILVQTQERGLEEKRQLLKEAEYRMSQNFKALSRDALKATQTEFLELARSTFDSQQREATSELEQRRVAVETLVRPVAAILTKVENRIVDLEKARQATETTLSEQVRQMATAQIGLQRETAQLVKAIRQPSGRGRWGEVQLTRVVELAGMQKFCDFYTPGENGEGAGPQRPNLIVNLPNGRIIAVDARAPLEAYLASVEAIDDEKHTQEMKRHAGMIGKHLAELASPRYRAQFLKKPEFIVLFLPSESFLSAALAEDPGLLERGIEQGVILATPATLVALLRSAAIGWRQEGVAEQARAISEAGRELYAHVSSLAEHVAKVGQSLDTTVQNYNVAIGSLEGSVLPGARKLSSLGVASQSSQLPAVAEIDHSVRHPRADLSRLPLSNRMDSMAATGEVPDASFEGFTDPAPFSDSDADAAADDLRAALARQEKSERGS
ncbi:MAG: DNA recombination protein RmuC [Akkermansiaceae bacterium]